MMSAYSFHNFMFPFRWNIAKFNNRLLSEQINPNNITFAESANWVRVSEPLKKDELDGLYNERNYFYEFVHDALYDTGTDNSLIRHFERIEPQRGDVSYHIVVSGTEYVLKVEAINLNIYSTGVGVLSFFMKNERYSAPKDVLNINQYGRRVFPPFIADVNYRNEIASSIEIIGLHGRECGYREDFSQYTHHTRHNTPAAFIVDMIHEVAENIELSPVVDDRMFVMSWYQNDEWASEFSSDCETFINKDPWYEFVFVDKYGGKTCQNKKMQERLIQEATYERWSQWSSLYGVSRYSMMCLTNSGCPSYLKQYFETEYVRMAELVLVQKASLLRFSAEVTNISELRTSRSLSAKVSSLYKEYIRFVNQIHFREISAQDQGIEMYNKLYDTLNVGKQVEKLDNEIEELHAYVSLCDDRKNSQTMSLLTWIVTIFSPITLISGIFGMNHDGNRWYEQWDWQLLTMGCFTMLSIFIILIIKKRRVK